jgi:hypothetical protein
MYVCILAELFKIIKGLTAGMRTEIDFRQRQEVSPSPLIPDGLLGTF